MSRLFSLSRRCPVVVRLCAPLVIILQLAGCSTYKSLRESTSASVGTGRTFAIYGLQGRWAGQITPAAADCGPATQGTMIISSNGFAFDPFGGTFVIDGTISEDGTFRGTLKRSLSGAGSKPVERSLVFTGNNKQSDRAEDRIVGRLVSGRCAWQVALHRA